MWKLVNTHLYKHGFWTWESDVAMIEPFRLLERQTLIAPLGVRFWDVATGVHVRNGLQVIAYPGTHYLHSTTASSNRSGSAYVFHRAWGLRKFELGISDAPFPESPPTSQRYKIGGHDENRRFLPVSFSADLPTAGVFQWPLAGPRTQLDPPDGSVPLYPSTLRSAPPGLAVLRAELYQSLNGARASWAMMEARFNGRLIGRGIADEQGRIALIFAYPPPQDSVGSSAISPPGSVRARLPFRNQEWTIQLQAFYEPAVLSLPLSPPGPSGSPRRDDLSVPELSDILKQSPANLFLDEAKTRPLTEVHLRYGPKVFVTPGSATVSSPPNPLPLSILFVSPAG
jgi:hypothetical protein